MEVDDLITFFSFSILTVFIVFLSKAELIILQLGNKKYKKCGIRNRNC